MYSDNRAPCRGADVAAAARRTARTAGTNPKYQAKTSGYSRCGIMFVLSKHIPSFDNLIVFLQSCFCMMKLSRVLETAAIDIGTKAR